MGDIAAIETRTSPAAVDIARKILEELYPNTAIDVDYSRFVEDIVTLYAT